MRILRTLAGGILLALASFVLVLGSIWLALAEGMIRLPSLPVFPSATVPAVAPVFQSLTPNPQSSTLTPQLPTPTLSCLPPMGWMPLLVSYGDTLESLAERYGVTPEELLQANCLSSNMLIPGSLFYVPFAPTATPIPCGPPPGWVQYIVQPGETLFRLGQAFGVDYRFLQRANCLGNSTLIYAGQRLWVPNIPTRTPPITDTPIIIIIATPTWTETATPLPTWTVLPTQTLSATPSLTPSASPTWTPSAVPGSSATSTPTLSPTPSPSATSTPTLSPTPSPSATAAP